MKKHRHSVTDCFRGVVMICALLQLCPGICRGQQGTAAAIEKPSPVGKYWLGVVPGAGLPLNLAEQDGGWVLYSPAQTGDQPYPATEWSLRNDTLRYINSDLGVRITLKVEPSRMTGKFRQMFTNCDITFEPAEGLFQMERPQEPQPPYPYREEAVRVQHGNITITGTLTRPAEGGEVPAVVLVSGSGQQNQDEEIVGHKPFKVLADRLTRNGIAVLRYNDRGIGGSTGEVENATTYDFAEDAEACFEWLRRQPGIDPKRVGIIGHSEGGAIAPIVASRNRKVAFVVMLAGPGCTGKEILLQQNRWIYELAGVDSALLAVRLQYLEALFEGREYKIPESLSKEERKAAGLDRGSLMMGEKQMEMPWMQAFLKLDPKRYLPKVKCPILALNGALDCQVTATENLNNIKQLNRRAEVVLLPGHNHLMQHCETGKPEEYILIQETLSEEVIDQILKFIQP